MQFLSIDHYGNEGFHSVMHELTALKEQFEYSQEEIYYWQSFAEFRVMLRKIENLYVSKNICAHFLSDENLLKRRNDFQGKLEVHFNTLLFEKQKYIEHSRTELLKASTHNLFLDEVEKELENRGLLFYPYNYFIRLLFFN